jgi:hypothetical protein
MKGCGKRFFVFKNRILADCNKLILLLLGRHTMTTLASLETANPNDADRDIALLDLDTEYSSYHRHEPLPAEFPDDTIEFAASDDFLGMLQQLVSDYGLPSGTAERFKRHHDDASNVPETEELRYTAAWDAYHGALDSDDDMATLARVYGLHVRMPLCDRISADGVLIF